MCDGEIISDKAFECRLVSLGKGFKPLAFAVDYLLLDRIGGSSFAVLCLSKTYGCRYHKYDGTDDAFHRSIPFCEYCNVRVDRARRLHSIFASINEVEKESIRATIQRIVMPQTRSTSDGSCLPGSLGAPSTKLI